MAESSISASPRQTWRVAGSSRRSPTSIDRRALARAAADERPQAGQQLGEGEGLDQVVVGAAVEPGDAVLEGAARGQHQDRRPDPFAAQPPAGLEAVDPGQHHVEDDRVVAASDRAIASASSPLAGDVDGQALLAQPAPQQRRHLHLVLDHQDVHTAQRSQRR